MGGGHFWWGLTIYGKLTDKRTNRLNPNFGQEVVFQKVCTESGIRKECSFIYIDYPSRPALFGRPVVKFDTSPYSLREISSLFTLGFFDFGPRVE